MDRVRKIAYWVWDYTWLGLFKLDLFLFHILLVCEQRHLKEVRRRIMDMQFEIIK